VIGFLKNPQSDTHVPCNLTISSWNEPLISTWKGGDAAGKFNVNEKWRLSVDVIASDGYLSDSRNPNILWFSEYPALQSILTRDL
jgi:hypothetical protein